MNLRVMVACKANKTAFASLLGRFESFNGSAGREDLLHFVHRGDLVNLPQVYMISLQSPQGFLEVCLRPSARTLGGFRRQKDMLSVRRQHVSVDLFRFPLPVNPGVVKIIDPEFVGAQRNSLCIFVAAQRESTTSLTDDRQSLASFAEDPLGNITPL